MSLDTKQQNKFSRQNAALGAETTVKLIKMRVIIYGLRGIGAETAKNLALQGIGGITLFDSAPIEIRDLGSNFFYTEADVGKCRSEILAPRLLELNPMCDVRIANELTSDLILASNALIVCNAAVRKDELIALDVLCRRARVSFLYAFTGGLTSAIFVDHGDNHTINDPNGEKPKQKIIESVRPTGTPNEVLVRYLTPDGQIDDNLESGLYKIAGVMGNDDINGKFVQAFHPNGDPVKTVRFKLADASTLEIVLQMCGDNSQHYVSQLLTQDHASALDVAVGGLLVEEKTPQKYPMYSLEHKIKNPGSPFSNDMVMFDLKTFSENQLHVAHIAVLTFAQKHDRYPVSADKVEVIAIAKELLVSGDVELPSGGNVDEEILVKASTLSGFELQPMAAFVGAVLAQEVVKCTGKFTPIPVC